MKIRLIIFTIQVNCNFTIVTCNGVFIWLDTCAIWLMCLKHKICYCIYPKVCGHLPITPMSTFQKLLKLEGHNCIQCLCLQ